MGTNEEKIEQNSISAPFGQEEMSLFCPRMLQSECCNQNFQVQIIKKGHWHILMECLQAGDILSVSSKGTAAAK